MDKEMIERLYNRGIRAYRSDKGNYFDEPPIDPEDPNDGGATPFARVYENGEEMWHALRAYQDEQRKKGEPINFRKTPQFHYGWRMLNVGEYHKIYSDWMGYPHIMLLESYKPDENTRQNLGQFTNFRWRPGHGPKGVN